MSEAPSETTPAPETAPETVPSPAAPAQGTDWKSEARKWEERAKSNKSELDELTGRFTTLSSEREELSTKVQTYESERQRNELVAEISRTKGVPASALRGNTREELESHAADLAELIKPSGPVIPGQERTPSITPASPEREFVGNLFRSE